MAPRPHPVNLNCFDCFMQRSLNCFSQLLVLLDAIGFHGDGSMAPRVQSPGYPNASLPKAIQGVRNIFDADRRNPIDREVAAQHLGYSGTSGASDKALATLAHYGLTEKVAKGEIRVSQLGLDIIHPDKPEDRKRALVQAAFNPQIFKDLRERFGGGHVSEGALESYLKRENFLDRAIGPVSKAYLETCRYLEQEKASESGGDGESEAEESVSQGEDNDMEPQQSQSEPARLSLAQRRAAAPGVGPLSASDMDHLPGPGMSRAAFPLAEGPVYLTFPEGLTADGYEELNEYLQIFLKRAQRQKRQQEARNNAVDPDSLI